MSNKILFVDDEPNVLQSIRRSLRKQFDLDTAEGGEEALRMLKANGTYAVIVSDMRMPGMNGVELLSQARKDSPDTVRMMLTGNADQQTAVDAVNHGDIFRFLNKPCEPTFSSRQSQAGYGNTN
ncbi:MAG: response regulator [Gammaproteobacteria bacterium]|nr:response regulator [Gammaproteobacteria bacterium]